MARTIDGSLAAELRGFISLLLESGVHKIIFSNPLGASEARRLTFNRLDSAFLCERLTQKQAFHSSVPVTDAHEALFKGFLEFSQANAWNAEREFTARITKKGKLLRGSHACSDIPAAATGHNRQKAYLIEEGHIIPPLVDMGVTDSAGRVKKSMYDKYRQINRFLELIDDAVRDEPSGTLNIVDFGCGKSYLTFIVYHYFTHIRKLQVTMTGIDLKQDVIDFCSSLSEKYGYNGLSFIAGDISCYSSGKPIDIMLSLHACDTATDYALYNAIKYGARYIFSAPCCQHELAGQAQFQALPAFADFGIARERFCALMTDTLRSHIVTACGYRVQLMEFVDLAHTPKNLLIRACKADFPPAVRRKAMETVLESCAAFALRPTLLRLIEEDPVLCSAAFLR